MPKTDQPLRFFDQPFVWRFSPNQTDPELLEAISVGRESLLQNVLEKIEDSATSGATHHVLLWGPRGIGKSHFLSLLFHRLNKDRKLSDAIRIARLREDETTTSMVQFLVSIYRSLGQAYPEEFSLPWLNELLNLSPEEVADTLVRRLVAKFEKRRLVILVENLNRLFENLGAEGQHRLRTLLQENPFACFIASSQQLFRAVSDRSEPFFGFFQPIPLRPLSLQDAVQLLIKIASAKGQQDLVLFLNTEDGLSRVRAIYDLSGGNHRVFIVLSGFLTQESLDEMVAPFKKMADDLMPYYQERLRGISPLQRQIVELLCSEHRTLNPKEIARRLLLTEQSIGKQVRNLVEIGYLTSHKKGRETFYELSEIMLRLAYELNDRSLLIPLLEFLKTWYRPDPMQQLQAAAQNVTTQSYADPTQAQTPTTPRVPQKPTHDDMELAEAVGRSQELAKLWVEKAALANNAGDWFKAGYFINELLNNPLQALTCYAKALQLDPQHAAARFSRSNALFAMLRWEEGFNAIQDAFSHSGNSANYLGDVASMFALIFRLSEDQERLQLRTDRLFDLYEQAARDRGFRNDQNPRPPKIGTIDPLSHLADGLVKSLAKIEVDRVTPVVLQSYLATVEQRTEKRSEFEIAHRLFRYGIRYLATRSEADFVELIQPERTILRQALGLASRTD